ncbi:hypothetical protein [Flavobacterium sp.]|uniref:hypothetical protein n=1 Tax=Flavobacterium sp. TaxID=239 RepID=UPI002615518C|nr:hypothetical protein [Flavobacterium sp.]
MFKLKKITILQIEKFLTIIFFLIFVILTRNTLIESYNRIEDLNTEKTIRIVNDKSQNENLVNFTKKDKANFSNHLDVLILLIIGFFIMFYKVQKKINVEKNKIE